MMRFPAVTNGSDIPDLAWGGMVPALLPPPLPREHPREQGKPWEGDAGLDRSTPQGGFFASSGPLIYPVFPPWLAPNIRARGWLRDGDPKRENVSLMHRSLGIGRVPQEVQTLLPSAVVGTWGVVRVPLLPDK